MDYRAGETSEGGDSLAEVELELDRLAEENKEYYTDSKIMIPYLNSINCSINDAQIALGNHFSEVFFF
jgi:hypothetical protein